MKSKEKKGWFFSRIWGGLNSNLEFEFKRNQQLGFKHQTSTPGSEEKVMYVNQVQTGSLY